MTRTIDMDATEGYLKYTIPLAGVGFAFAQTRLGSLNALFGVETLLGGSLPKLSLGLLLALFAVSTVAGLFAISAITGARNDAAGFKALSPNQRHAKLTDHTTSRARRMRSAYRNSNVHLIALIAGFIAAFLVFLGEAFNPTPKPQFCEARLLGLQIDFPCGGSLKDLYQSSKVMP